VKKLALAAPAFFLLVPAILCAAQPTLGWPEAIARLTQEREQAVTCVGLLKSSGGDAAHSVKATYELARGEMAGVIDGLTVVLVEGGKPESLPTIQDSLARSGKSLQDICDAALKTVAPHTKGVWEEVAKGAVEPLVQAISDGIGAVWKSSVDKDKLAIDTKKTKLEAARWPEFGDIAPR
jgi:hypothetical protein